MRRFLFLPTALALTLSCGGELSILEPGGPAARELSSLSWFLIVLMSTIVLVMGGLVLVAGLRRRGSLDTHETPPGSEGMLYILIGGVLAPAAVFLGLYVTGLVAAPHEAEEAELRVLINARQWWWDVEYVDADPTRRFATANEIHIPVGEPVEFQLQSIDVIHSFWIPRLAGKIDAIPGRTNRIVVRADEPGVYRGECAEYCGMQHAHMRFLVVAEPRSEFVRWSERQRRGALAPADSVARRGQELFLTNACAFCHAIRGTSARGSVAPDLTHLGERRTIAAGLLPNRRANLQAWVVSAPELKPGTQMPAMPVFDGRELNALVTYLQGLR